MEWSHGQKAELAKLADISKQYLNDILNGKKCPRETARRLEAASLLIGLYIPRYDFMESDKTENPLFKNGMYES